MATGSVGTKQGTSVRPGATAGPSGTNREGRSFLSETDIDNDISVEIFLLGASRTDMTGFEKAGEEPEARD